MAGPPSPVGSPGRRRAALLCPWPATDEPLVWADAGALRITCTTTADDALDRLTVEVVALYGTPLVPLATRIRARAADAVAATLGLDTPPTSRVHVDVSVQDVTDDPRTL